VRGLDLFEQVPARAFSDDTPLFGPKVAATPSPAEPQTTNLPPPIDFDSSPYLTPSDYDEGGPSATDRFRKGLSAVSSGVLKTVRGIPRRAWRMTALILGAVLVIAFIVWSISKLYEATSTPQATTTPPVAMPAGTSLEQSSKQPESPAGNKAMKPISEPSKTTTPSAKPPKDAAPSAKPPKAASPTVAPSKPGKLISTGQNIPNIFAD